MHIAYQEATPVGVGGKDDVREGAAEEDRRGYLRLVHDLDSHFRPLPLPYSSVKPPLPYTYSSIKPTLPKSHSVWSRSSTRAATQRKSQDIPLQS
eukprot:1458033-Rhodomonas_salina.3